MAKMTISGLQTAMKTYVDASKQAGTWTASTNNFAGMLDKVGKIVTIDGSYQDKLPELEGEELPLGKTIEEYFIDLTLPEAMSGNNATEGAKDSVPSVPTVEEVCYSYSLGRQKIKTTVPYDNYERACLTSEDASNMGAKIVERLENSSSLTRFAEKKQLLGNAITKALAVDGCHVGVAVPTDTNTSEAFITQIKKDAEEASFAHEGGLNKALIGATDNLILFVKKGVLPVVQVQALAGAIHNEELAVPAKVVVVDDFGSVDGAWALLCDPRGIKLHSGYKAIRTKENADGDFVNFVKHFEDTGFISKYTFIKAYTA